MSANLENSAVATGLEKVSFHSNPKESSSSLFAVKLVSKGGIIAKERQCKECSNYRTISLISNASKVMLKILQARLQQYMNHEYPNVQAGFRKGRGTRDQTVNICWIIIKTIEFQKNIYFYFIDYAKEFDHVDDNKQWKILKEMGIPDHLTCLLRNCMQVRKQQLELDMEQQTGSK